ncbi:MAG TPA: T9SS type A sorting domain-containing protein [Bacteroidetes bacterium]|nr:T9SS type A sorting domain-containing protein [Bacteroidota bacterium]
MKRFTRMTILAALCVPLLITATSAIPPPSVRALAGTPLPGERWDPGSMRLPFGPQVCEIAADSVHSYDALHLEIEIQPDIPADLFDAVVTMSVVSNEDPLSQLSFHLAGCTIDSILADGEAVAYSAAGELVTITFDNPPPLGDTVDVTVVYSGLLRGNNYFGGMIYSSTNDVLYTFGEPYTTRYWLACYDLPFDKVTSRVTVIMDSEYRVLSNGVRTEEVEIAPGVTRTVWDNPDPISTYLISLAAHPYAVIDGGTGGENDIPVSFWAYRPDSAQAAYEFGRTAEMIDVFEGLFGPYPFNKYDQAMAPIFNGWGAMEHQTATTYGYRLVEYGGRTFESIVAHELGHQWWGDMVGPLTFAHIWLNEGFASYADALWAEHLSSSAFHGRMSSFRDSYMYEDNNELRYPIYDPPPNFLFGSAIYDKGAWVLHMLRYLMGDDDFFAGLQLYGQTYAYGSATIDEFQGAMELASGLDLDSFFDEWIYQAGYPIYHFSNLVPRLQGDGTYTASLELYQSQTNAPIFTIPLPLKFFTSGRDTLVRVEVAPERTQTLNITGLEFSPTWMSYDPEQWILALADVTEVAEGGEGVPRSFVLSSPWPNPFNAETSLEISLPRRGEWSVDVFDLLGRRVARLADGVQAPGVHRVLWRPDAGTSSGVYWIRVIAPGGEATRRVVLLK